jgi:prophage regulatory protein
LCYCFDIDDVVVGRQSLATASAEASAVALAATPSIHRFRHFISNASDRRVAVGRLINPSRLRQPMNPQPLLRLPAVIQMTGLARSTIYKLMGEGQFPGSRKITQRSVAWSSADIALWIDSRAPSRSTDLQSK